MSTTPTSLSKYFPEETVYYYGYPAGQDSAFYNQCPAAQEELVAMRPTVCAGDNIRVLCFNATVRRDIQALLRNEIGQSVVPENRIMVFPQDITQDLPPAERNKRIKNALKRQVSPGKLVMAQPYNGSELAELYQIDPNLTIYLNDKKNIPDLAPKDRIVQQYGSYSNGSELSKIELEKCQLPCVIKVSSSSAGDGVRICKTLEDIKKAIEDFKDINETIIVQEHIDQARDLAIDFAIPQDPNLPIEILGLSEQITDDSGEYLGGRFDKNDKSGPEIQKIYQTILEQILPKVRQMGWYGVGGVDVLLKENGDFYFIDFNFRMTATTPYNMQIKNGRIIQPLISFSGTFNGTEADFKRDIANIARTGDQSQKLHIITLSERKGVYRLNAGLLYDQP